MRNLNELNEYRQADLEIQFAGAVGGADEGLFQFACGDSQIRVIASAGMGWDHLSVSTPDRCPTWEEMEAVRKLFAKPDEVWMQLGLPARLHINCHPYCLHWWRKHHGEVKLPPSIMVGPRIQLVR